MKDMFQYESIWKWQNSNEHNHHQGLCPTKWGKLTWILFFYSARLREFPVWDNISVSFFWLSFLWFRFFFKGCLDRVTSFYDGCSHLLDGNSHLGRFSLIFSNWCYLSIISSIIISYPIFSYFTIHPISPSSSWQHLQYQLSFSLPNIQNQP